MDNEIDFPRGGTKPTKAKNVEHKQNQKQTPFPKKRKRTTSPENFIHQDTELLSTAADIINYKRLQEQMLLLGCLRNIAPFSLEIELPGKTSGKVSIALISTPFTNLLRRKAVADDVEEEKDIARLNSMFQIGQFLPTKIIEKKEIDNKTDVALSIDPKDINSEWNHQVFKEKLLVWAAVSSKLDHGYTLDAGVRNSRIFLPFSNIEKGTELFIGQPLWCIVTQSEVTPVASTIKVSILKKDLMETMQNNNVNLHYLIPGMQFNLTITKNVIYGLQGKFLKQCVGYINENYLVSPMDKPNKYSEGETVKAWLLYVQPTTNFSHFSLRSVWEIPTSEYEIGQILRAQVLSKAAGGINLKFSNNEKGFMSYKRIMHVLPKNNVLNLNDAVSKKFPSGSSHRFRILDYNHMEQVYICSCEQSVLNEKYFAVNDVKIGEMVNVQVERKVRDGLVVSLGNIKCFIQNLHLSDTRYSEIIKTKFKDGQKLKARVWNIDSRGVYLTLKQKLINSDVCLANKNDAIVGQKYPGLVAHTSERGVLVVFYNGIQGFLSKKDFNKLYEDDIRSFYYIGEIIEPVIKNINNNDLQLCLEGSLLTAKLIKIGQYIDATVTKCTPVGLEVQTKNNVNAFVPLAHLSSSLTLTPLLLETYNVGDTLKNLLCLSNKQKPILSLREAKAYSSQRLKPVRYQELKVGSLLRCCYEKSDESGVYVSTPLLPKSVTFKIPSEQFTSGDTKLINLEYQQAIVAKVLKFDKQKQHIVATSKITDVFDFNYEYSLNLLQQYLEDSDRIKAHLLKKKSPLANLHLGQNVQCVVSGISKSDSNCCKLELPKNIKGFAFVRKTRNLKPGQKVKGTIYWINYAQEFVELSLENKQINNVQDGNINKQLNTTSYADILTVHPEYMVAVTRTDETNRQLIFLPPRFHENNFGQSWMNFNPFEKKKIIVCRKVNGKLIGVEKGCVHKLKKAMREKRKSTEILGNLKNKKPRLDNVNGDGEKGEAVEIQNDFDNDESDSNEHSTEDNSFASDANIPFEDEHETDNNESDEDGEYEEEENEDDDRIKNTNKRNDNRASFTLPVLPGIENFFCNSKDNSFEEEASSDDDDISQVQTKEKKKKRLSVAERKELARLEEEELIRKEIENADATSEPKTDEQFQKLLKGHPNNSKLWLKYIAHLVANTEFERARHIARDALKTINLELVTERYNIWLALLNLENRFGEKDSFEEVFNEAVTCNNPLDIYLSTIEMLADLGKLEDMEDKIQKAKKKLKTELQMWVKIGNIYYITQQLQKARNFKTAALLALPSKLAVQLLVQYALMEFQHGEKIQGEALFETIIQNNPKRVDIWTTYVDQVIKKGDIDTARRILERAVSQGIPSKKLRTLFKKYKDFETKYGTEEQLNHVIQLAKNYVSEFIS